MVAIVRDRIAAEFTVRILSVVDAVDVWNLPRWRNGRRSGLKPRGPLKGVWVRIPLSVPVSRNVDGAVLNSPSVPHEHV